MAYFITEHAQRGRGVGLTMFADMPLPQSLKLGLAYSFAFDRNPVTCTTILLKQQNAPPSLSLGGYGDEDYRDVRERLVGLGLFKDINMAILDGEERHGGHYRHSEDTLRRFARGEVVQQEGELSFEELILLSHSPHLNHSCRYRTTITTPVGEPFTTGDIHLVVRVQQRCFIQNSP